VSGERVFSRVHALSFIVMAGLDPAIHVFASKKKEDVDARDKPDKPGHDER